MTKFNYPTVSCRAVALVLATIMMFYAPMAGAGTVRGGGARGKLNALREKTEFSKRQGERDRARGLRGEKATVRRFSTMGGRLKYSKALLGRRELTQTEKAAIKKAHLVGKGEKGRDGKRRAGILADDEGPI